MKYETKVMTAKNGADQDQKVFEAAEILLRRIKERRLTGTHTIQVDSNQGGVTKVTFKPEEQV